MARPGLVYSKSAAEYFQVWRKTSTKKEEPTGLDPFDLLSKLLYGLFEFCVIALLDNHLSTRRTDDSRREATATALDEATYEIHFIYTETWMTEQLWLFQATANSE
ncbi:hypothetical protein AVEN_167450-1 [Araneus ventricosus]|uniref:Uncharacterized protein n=1 Tax=Araneus ventricosus TaxID=182803 RepID=A0A4Y2EN77_ARAVE|nr:hypothetical protein AVEN_167450-1 [Araneus ventricosus]